MRIVLMLIFWVTSRPLLAHESQSPAILHALEHFIEENGDVIVAILLVLLLGIWRFVSARGKTR